jgi:hypothetical protein
MKKIGLGNLAIGLSLAIFANVQVDTSKLEVKKPYIQLGYVTEVKAETPKKETIEDMIKRIWKVDEQTLKVVIATAKHENGYQLRDGWKCDLVTGNKNGSEDVGIFAINTLHHSKFGGKEALLDCETNIKAGYEIYKERQRVNGQGLSAWYSFLNNKYLMFM